MREFDFNIDPVETQWVVDGFIPRGHLCLVLAQAGVGKSLLVENLAVHIVFGQPFCSMKTIEGDVLLIDQDTPTDVLTKRLASLGKGIQAKQKHKLFVESMNQYSLYSKSSSNSLATVINKHETAMTVIIDCLHSVCDKLNPNSTGDMGVLARLKQECLTGERTIIINHHISEKRNLTIDELMASNPHSLSMGNSAIIQQADTYYIVGGEAENGLTNKLFIRPVAKRVAISSKPLVLKVTKPTDDSEGLEYFGMFEPEFSELEQDILTLFRERPSDRSIKDMYDDVGHKATEKEIRESLASLEKKGLLIMNRKSHNLFKYRLP